MTKSRREPFSTAGNGELTRPRAILFDWDNTLIDSWLAIHDAQNHTLTSFGMEPWTLEETRQRVRGSMRDTFPQMFGERWLEAGDVFYARFAEKHMRTLTPLPGARELLERLAASGIYLGVVSNKKGHYLRREAEHLGWSSFFGRIVGAFDAARDKPSVEPVDMALRGSGIEPGKSVWFVGDADIDLECAQNAGCVPVLVRESSPEPDEFVNHPPDLHVDSCMMLLKVVMNL
jgi:phosphoglycolate phosphatase